MSSSVNVLSQFKEQRKMTASTATSVPEKKAQCPDCKKMFAVFRKLASGKVNKKPFRECQECWRKSRKNHSQAEVNNDMNAVIFDLSLIQRYDSDLADGTEPLSVAAASLLPHHTFSDGSWIQKAALAHPKVELEFSVNAADYKTLLM